MAWKPRSRCIKRIAILISTLQNIQGDSRRDAFAAAMHTAGLPLEVIEIEIGNEAQEDVKETVKKYITLHGVPDGIFCTSDFNAVPAHRAIREMGLCMPEDIALIGFDGTDICKYLDPQLSTVAVPRDKICKKACDMLLARIKQPNKKAHTVKIVPVLELRESAKKVQSSPDKSGIPPESE
jgi:DNA-binding LacI/PurR family transcriptional regulator